MADEPVSKKSKLDSGSGDAGDEQSGKVYPGFTGEAFPDVFTKMPPQPSTLKPGQQPESVIKEIFDKGYVIVKDFFKKEELNACRDAIKEEVDALAQKLYKAGKIKDLHEDAGLFERLTLIEKDFPGTNVLLHKMGKLPKAFSDLWANERLLNFVEQLIGPEICASPVWNLRTKTPQNEATIVPWHQDNAYFANEVYSHLVPTAWIPLLDATEMNGCMQFAERGHRSGKVANHQCCHGGTWYVMLEEKEMASTLGVDLEKDLKVCPVPYGGLIMFHNLTPHRSLPNMSKDIRWSLDLRWQSADSPTGFFGLKEKLLLRSAKDPDHKPDWDSFNLVDRNVKQLEYCRDVLPAPEDPEFDTTIQGPWMKKWEIVHVNRHTDALRKLEEEQKDITWTKS